MYNGALVSLGGSLKQGVENERWHIIGCLITAVCCLVADTRNNYSAYGNKRSCLPLKDPTIPMIRRCWGGRVG